MKEEKTDFRAIERRWQDKWEKKKAFKVSEKSKKNKFYVLEQFPYPSGSGLHVGHAFVYTIGDIFSRFKIMQGFNVLHPMGYDSLGLPAENAANETGVNPKKYTEKAIEYFSKQQKAIGLSYDWDRMFATHKPEYYKWDQWIFLKLLEKGLAYQKESPVNYCRKCDTVLANEQVHNGKCWRHGDTPVEIKHLKQWYFKITDYAEELNDFSKLNHWPDLVKKLQKNWIGKSYGTEIEFEIPTKANFVLLHGYTGSPDTNFFPWLKKELEDRGYKVSAPTLPNTNNPKIKEQVDYVIKNCRFDENTVLLGHSLGSVIALKVIEQLNKPIKKLILAAGFIEPNTKDRPYVKTFDWKFNLEKIKKNARQIIIFKDKNDKAIRKEAAIKLKNAIGGTIIEFEAQEQHICGEKELEVLNSCLEKWPIFTTRPDTIYGVTFMVVSAQHPRLAELVTKERKEQVEKFVKKLSSVKEEDIDQLEKEGVFTGSYAINPINNEKVPVYAGNFVLADYGCGMVMAVPAHDQRDFEFAKKYNIPIKEVISGGDIKNHAYTEKGILVNSGEFNGLDSEKAKEEIMKELEKKKLGKKTINFRLRDWLISRQRYWGTPIPIIYCEKCGIVPVGQKDLPVKLPEKVKFGKGNPLETAKDWIKVRCPNCKGNGKRETDTMDTFVNSSWYHLRFCDPKNNTKIFNPKKANYWNPVDVYVGGKEHACMHDIYIRFYHKFLRDLGLLKTNEPAEKLFVQGIVHGEDGNKMSKSLGNTVDPMEIINKYGADSLRLFLVSVASPDSDFNWSDKGVSNVNKLINKIIDYFKNIKIGKSSASIESKINKSIKEITEDIENFRYNLAVIKLRQLFEAIEKEKEINKKDAEGFLKLLSVFCPHIAEELWEKIKGKGFISLSGWPECDEKKIDEKLEKQEEQKEKLLADIKNIIKILEQRNELKQKKIIKIFTIPKEIEIYKQAEEQIKKIFNMRAEVLDIREASKIGKSVKAQPGKPGIYLE